MTSRVGFTTGTLHKHCNAVEAMKIFRESGVSVLELGDFWGLDKTRALDETTFANSLRDFEYVSLHAPKIEYGANEKTEEVIKKITEINSLRKLDNVVFHPDCVKDFNIFADVGFPIIFENMDKQKNSFKYPEEFKNLILNNDKFNMVLDVNHMYTNDPTMKIGESFHRDFEGRISEYHLSGFEELHEPLYKTKQKNIIDAILIKNIPIIIESMITPEEVGLELEYVTRELEGQEGINNIPFLPTRESHSTF